MRVFAKKTFEFKDSDGEKYKTIPMGFAELPDWVRKTPLFEAASKAKDIEVIVSEKKVSVSAKPTGE